MKLVRNVRIVKRCEVFYMWKLGVVVYGFIYVWEDGMFIIVEGVEVYSNG